MSDATLSTLEQIRTKVRRLTRTPSTAQLSNSDLDNYINTAVLYDFPEHLRLFALRTTLTFYTTPNVDVYETNTTDSTNPLYNFKNKYITLHPPFYVAGNQAFFTQDRSQFFANYPPINAVNQIATGDGVTTVYSGTLTGFPVLQNQVMFNSADADGKSLILVDLPDNINSPDEGDLIVPDNTATTYGTINYVTGVYSVTFPTAPADGVDVNSQTVVYQASRPQSVLYYDNKFTLRPVPDQAYRIQMEAYVRPTELLTTSQQPELAEWAQWISYLAAKKVFEDRMDMDSVQLIMPELKNQERLVIHRTIVQQSNERTSTIYSQSQPNNWFGSFGWFNN